MYDVSRIYANWIRNYPLASFRQRLQSFHFVFSFSKPLCRSMGIHVAGYSGIGSNLQFVNDNKEND